MITQVFTINSLYNPMTRIKLHSSPFKLMVSQIANWNSRNGQFEDCNLKAITLTANPNLQSHFQRIFTWIDQSMNWPFFIFSYNFCLRGEWACS